MHGKRPSMSDSRTDVKQTAHCLPIAGTTSLTCAKKRAAGRYREKPLCLARMARPSNEAVVSERVPTVGKSNERKIAPPRRNWGEKGGIALAEPRADARSG